MKRTILGCDICKSEDFPVIEGHRTPVKRLHDGNDGREFYKNPVLNICEIDICENCLNKVAKMQPLTDNRIMGNGEIKLEGSVKR